MATLVRACLAGLLGLVSQLGASAALAGAFQISPLRVSLSAAAPSAVLKVLNAGTEASVMQLSVMAWSQTAGQDAYLPSNEVLVTPPIFTVPPGATQIIRVVLRRAPHARREIAYRLFLQEVPTLSAQEVRVALRFAIPMFVTPLGKLSAPSLDWRVLAKAQGTWRIEAINRGDGHVQVVSFALASPTGAPLARHQGMAYLLPDQRHQWVVTPTPTASAPPRGRYSIVAQTDAGELHAEAPLEP